MKKSLIISFFFSLSIIAIKAQTVTNNAESGNRTIDQANCWVFGAVGYSNTAAQVIAGTWSMRGNSLSNPSLDACWIKSPWLKPATGNITLKVKMENTTGLGGGSSANYKKVSIRFIEYDPIASFGEGNFVAAQQDHVMSSILTNGRTRTENLTFTIPANLVTSDKPIKVMFSFSGDGGNNRPNIDDIVIPGTYFSNPPTCTPLVEKKDKDGDGVEDGDDAYPEDKFRAFDNYLPTSAYNSLMFEDLWPGKGDFDFNDLVVDYKINRITNAKDEIVDIKFFYKVKAIGASFKNGLGVEFTNIPSNKVYSVSGNNISAGSSLKFESNGLESGTNHLTFIAFDNAFNLLPYAGGGVTGVNTNVEAPRQVVKEEIVTLSLIQNGVPASGSAVKLNDLSFDNFNPFLIANQRRGYEIHLADKTPTALADTKLFGTSEDVSNPATGIYYKQKDTFLPWALNVPMSVPYMVEKGNFEKGYPKFRNWVESKGVEFADWYVEKYRESVNLYQ